MLLHYYRVIILCLVVCITDFCEVRRVPNKMLANIKTPALAAQTQHLQQMETLMDAGHSLDFSIPQAMIHADLVNSVCTVVERQGYVTHAEERPISLPRMKANVG